MEKKCGIYKFENKINKKIYIGQSVDIYKRKNEHWQWPSPYSKIDSALTKYGLDNFNFSIIEECEPNILDEREKYWIKYYDSINYEKGYNLTIGGQNYRGESNPASKLTEKEVLEIIELLKECKLNNKQISILYNISNNAIDEINRCIRWTHLHNYKNNIRQENLNLKKYPHSSLAGENNPISKITEKQALYIIELLKKDKRSMAQISRDEKISIYIISDINACKTWTYLHNYKKNIRKEFREKNE